jgi:ATP-dependent DNA helicase RecQ
MSHLQGGIAVITGAEEHLHPARLKLAGKTGGTLFDRLQETQLRLSRGEDGTGKLLSCPPATLARIAAQRPHSLSALARIAGFDDAKLDRFGPAFLDLITEA